MKTNKLFLSMLLGASLALTACSNEEPKGGENDTNVQYLAVNIVATPQNGSRATGDPDGATYEDGTEKENAVSKVRFYFFKSDGKPAAVKADLSNYYDWTPSSAEGSSPNVEKVLTATIVLSSVDGDNMDTPPTQMVAILNPDYASLPAGSPTLSTLRNLEANYASNTANPNGFVMMNSVYLNGATRIATTPITAANIAKEPSTALANPVNIYVERNVAKVRLAFDGVDVDAEGKILLKNASDENILVDGNPIYLKVDGWDLTATTTQAYLSKHVTDTWPSNLFGSVQWNWAPYFRCFWAINPGDAGQNYYPYNAISALTIGGANNVAYTNENAGQKGASAEDPDYTPREYPTQVIIKGHLVSASGAVLELVEYAGTKMVGQDNLKTQMVNYLNLYKKTVVGETETYTKITPSQVKLVTALVNGSAEEGQENGGRYFVELQLADSESHEGWCTSNTPGSTPLADDAALRLALKSVGHGKVWASGQTYYYFPIAHLAPAGTGLKPAGSTHTGAGEYGVVRNHIYDCKISKITGLGTPIYDPNEKVWPEKPKDDTDTYVAATINILSWRVVNNPVILNW